MGIEEIGIKSYKKDGKECVKVIHKPTRISASGEDCFEYNSNRHDAYLNLILKLGETVKSLIEVVEYYGSTHPYELLEDDLEVVSDCPVICNNGKMARNILKELAVV